VRAVAQLVKDSKHTVVYTGAGISTNARLPDYRGPKGIWTLKEQGLTPDTIAPNGEIDPTHGHLALTALNRAGLVDHVVSTNIDGLHLRSGLGAAVLSELHGNAYTEKCSKCNHVTIRQITFDLIKNGVHPDHLTGNTCSQPGCGGELRTFHFTFKILTSF
jgi:NAD-dependent SIR2 family protein deacetylase